MIYEVGRLQRRPEVEKPLNSFDGYDTSGDYVPEVDLRPEDPEPGGFPPFSPRSIVEEGGSYRVVLQEGWLVERYTRDDGGSGVRFYMPEVLVDGEYVPMNDRPRPSLLVPLENYVYLVYSTNNHGEVLMENGEPPVDVSPWLEVSDEDTGGAGAICTHYQPPDPEGAGVEGEYRVKLLYLEEDPENPGEVKATVYQQSDVEHYHELPTLVNMEGDGDDVDALEIFKKRNKVDDTYELRSLQAGYGINGLTDPEDYDGMVVLEVEAENVGASTGLEVYIPPDTPAEGEALAEGPMQFRRLADRGSCSTGLDAACEGAITPQIKVILESEDNPGDPPSKPIRIVGNGACGTLTWVDCEDNETPLIAWKDGLIISVGDIEFTAGCTDASSQTIPP